MFSNVVVERGFSRVTFNQNGLFSGVVEVPRSSVLPLIGMEVTVTIPENTNIGEFSPFFSALDPAILYLISMSRIAAMLEIEHKTYARLSRTDPINVMIGGDHMMTIIPVEDINGQWGAHVDLHGDTPGQFPSMDWPAQAWSWESMVTNALAFPALSLIGAMGLGEDFEDRLRKTDAQFAIRNKKIDPDKVEVLQTDGVEVVMMDDEKGAPTFTDPVPDPHAPIIVEGEDDFDRSFRELLRKNKKEGLDA